MSAFQSRFLIAVAIFSSSLLLFGGVSKEIQNSYVEQYKNRAMFLKVPVHGLRQTIFIGNQPVLDRSTMGEPLAFKVGEQVRITDLNFRDELIRFKIAAVDFSRQAELHFRFSLPLTADFPNQAAFERGLSFVFAEGASYREIDAAKETFITGQFDRLIEQFASTTGTTPDYVVKTISEQNPEFRKMRQAIEGKERELAQSRAELEKEAARRREAESQASRLRREFEDLESRFDGLRTDQTSLTSERDRSQRQVRQLGSEIEDLQKKQEEHQKQIRQLLSTLDVKTSSNAELDQQVRSLGTVVADLKGDRDRLTQELQQSKQQTEELLRNKEQLTKISQQLEDEKRRLSANLRDLTSDKDSLNSRYLKLKEEKDALATADRLGEALQLRSVRESAGLRVSDLYLLSAKIGTLEVVVPEAVGSDASIKLALDSPDTVKFSEEERRLHQALGEEMTVTIALQSPNPELSFQLAGGEETQSIAPREEGAWQWSLAGSISEPATVSLLMHLVDSNEQAVRLPAQEFTLNPSGLSGWLNHRFSVWFLFVAFALGLALAMTASILRNKPQRTEPSIRKPQRIAEKRL